MNNSDVVPHVVGGKYTLENLIQKGDPVFGAPSIWRASSMGSDYVLKLWPRPTPEDPALRAVWNHEVRGLLKLGSIPNASELFATLAFIGIDERNYYVSIDTGGKILLSEALQRRAELGWLKTSDPAIRSKLWLGIAQIAKGLDLLHSHGTLHRSLSTMSVFTDTHGDCDFRLSGFEWSLRLSAATYGKGLPENQTRMRAPELTSHNPTYSPASDWFDLGVLAYELFYAKSPTGNGLDVLHELTKFIRQDRVLTQQERDTIIQLLTPNPDERRTHISGIAQKINWASLSLSTSTAIQEKPLHIAFLVTETSAIAEAVNQVTEGRIKRNDTKTILRFLEDDLREDPEVMPINDTDGYVVFGKQLTYRVRQYADNTRRTWNAGFCASLGFAPKQTLPRLKVFGREIRPGTPQSVRTTLASPTGRYISWTSAFPFQYVPSDHAGKDAFDFLKFTNYLDALIAAVRVWRVDFVGQSKDERYLYVRAADDPDRDDLATKLLGHTPAEQMHMAFVNGFGDITSETEFILTDAHMLQRLSGKERTRWRYRRHRMHDDGRIYEFEATIPVKVDPRRAHYLKRADSSGTIELLERRLTSIEGLWEQQLMLRALESPARFFRDTHDDVGTSKLIEDLDDSKKAAIKQAWRAQPFFLIQGPPGTGKTKLVEALVHKALTDDPSLQFLVTAQANATVDDIGGKIHKILQTIQPGSKQPMAVRLDDPTSPNSPENILREMLPRLLKSPLAKRAPQHIRERLAALSSDQDVQGRHEINDMLRLIEESSNVVLSTTTSSALDVLVEDGKRYDWCIIEEAAKAHGFELALPMRSSHRVLLIGDHQQLPAFNEAIHRKVLKDPALLSFALTAGRKLLKHRYRLNLNVEEGDDDEYINQGRSERWAPMVQTFGYLFNESKRLLGEDAAHLLSSQHRMAPEICELLKETFYPSLSTHDNAKSRLKTSDPFDLIAGSWMPAEKIVFVDVPYIQVSKTNTGQRKTEDGSMILESKIEAEKIAHALAQIRPNGECTLQVITPYNAQIGVVRDQIESGRRNGKLPHLMEFVIKGGDGRIGMTVDQFQGNEADIIVSSLVRNNHENRHRGVGFLDDARRWSVLLSRAKRKLILVGSWDFFMRRVTPEAFNNPDDKLHSLAVVFTRLEELRKRNLVALHRGPTTW